MKLSEVYMGTFGSIYGIFLLKKKKSPRSERYKIFLEEAVCAQV